MSTLVAQVRTRWPVAVVSVYGTLDANSAARLMVALRDALADAPSALVIEVEHLVVAADSALVPLIALADEAKRWPAAGVAFCGATNETTAALTRVGGAISVYDDVTAATTAAQQLPAVAKRSTTLSPSPSAPAQSRQFTVDVCAEWGMGRVANIAELVASELVTNAVTHARTQIGLILRLAGDTLSVAVRDGDPRPMFRPAPGAGGAPGDEHGRGLLLLDAMADTWGSNPTPNGKIVWANIGVRRSARSPDDRLSGPGRLDT